MTILNGIVLTTCPDERSQVADRAVLHHDVELRLVRKAAIVLDDVGLVALSEQLDLTRNFAIVELSRHDLDRANPIALMVERLEDLAKRAAAQKGKKKSV